MRTSTSWWNETKNDPELLLAWMRNQYHGETMAAQRIQGFLDTHVPEDHRWRRTIEIIRDQELAHSRLMADLLRARGIEPALLNKPERYWNQTLPVAVDFETGAAVAAHAEELSLERIEAIATNAEGPPDVYAAFQQILRDERFHAKAFRRMAGEPAFAATLREHERGMVALGHLPA